MSGLGSIPPDTPRALRQWLERLQERIEVTDAVRGSPLKAQPTIQDLIDIGVIKADEAAVLKANGRTFRFGSVTNWLTAAYPEWFASSLNPPTPTGLTVAADVGNLRLAWAIWDSVYYLQTRVYRASSNNLNAATLIGSTSGGTYVDNLPPSGGAYYYWIQHESRSHLSSDFNDVNGTTAGNVAGAPAITPTIDGRDVVLSYPTPASNLAIRYYVVRHGAAFASGTEVGTSNTNTFRFPANFVGARTFWIAAVDINGTTGIAGSAVVTIVAPAAPLVTQTIQNDALVLTYGATPGSLPLIDYEIRHGASWAAGTTVQRSSSTRFETIVNWTGSRTFHIGAYDSAGNIGATAALVFTPVAPSIVTIAPTVIDNFVMLRWTASSATLRILHYKVYREGSLFGTFNGLFAPIFESASADYDYGIAAVDTALNEGTQATVTVSVAEPPDFELLSDADTDFDGANVTKTQTYKDTDGSLLCNVDTAETWATHFSSRSWNSIDDQIAAGYSAYVVGKTTGSYREDVDYGATIPSSRITMTPTIAETQGAGMTIAPLLYTSVDGTTWSAATAAYSAYGTSFRYVRFHMNFSTAHTGTGLASDTANLIRIKPLNFRLDVKKKTQEYSVACVSTDGSGTSLNITGDFIDISSIQVTAHSTTAVFPTYNFTDAANPTTIYVFLWDAAGTRVSGNVTITIRGV